MFTFEEVLPVEDVNKDTTLAAHRRYMDAGARGRNNGARFVSESIVPYVIYRTLNGLKVAQPETDETRKYKVLIRNYE
jgi:hypothetical protein